MITSVATSDKAKWDKLFADASADAGVQITTLREYIEQLNKLVGVQGKYQYLRMPNEPVFVVDDTTREIVVPDVFRKNGLGVAGDHKAETIWFKMGRYFDGMDLNHFRGDNVEDGVCLIHWKRRGLQGDSRLSKAIAFTAYSKDQDSEEGDTIYFGWNITDEVTEVEGTIDFAVRFVQINEDHTIRYALSTRSNYCDIKSALELPNGKDFASIDIEDVEDEILHRSLYSGIVNTVASSLPRITDDLDALSDLVEMTENDETFKALDLTITAHSDDNGTISYEWREQDSSDRLASTETILEDKSVTSVCRVNKPGTYVAFVGNETSKGKRVRPSNTCTVPAANEIVIVEDTEFDAQGYMEATKNHNPTEFYVAVIGKNGEPANGTVKYLWKKDGEIISGADTTSNTYTPVEEGKYSVEVQNERNNSVTKAISRNECDIRKAPVKPTGVQISYDAENKILHCTVDSPTRDLAYLWSSSQQGKLQNDYDPLMNSFALNEEQAQQGDYFCTVVQSIFHDSVAMREDSFGTSSAILSIYDGVVVS